jgi:hypothetical protein
VAGVDVELHLALRAHAHQQLLQDIRALAAGVDPLLNPIDCEGLFKRGEHLFFADHDFSASYRAKAIGVAFLVWTWPFYSRSTGREARWNPRAALMDFAGNPYGTYDQEEPCIHCGARLKPPRKRNFAQRVATKLAFWNEGISNLFVAPRGKWIHILFRKK